MQYSDDMFGNQKGFGTEMAAATIVLSAMTVVMLIFVAANFRVLTATIAIGVAEILSSGIPILLTIVAIIYFMIKIRWKMRRRFLGW